MAQVGHAEALAQLLGRVPRQPQRHLQVVSCQTQVITSLTSWFSPLPKNVADPNPYICDADPDPSLVK